MGNQQFSIQQNIFEIDIADRTEVHQLQNRISRLVNDRLTERMNGYFSKIIPEDMLLTIDQLSYDVGEVNWDDLEEEIEERFMKALEEDLALRLRLLENSPAGNATGIRSSGVLTGKIELLEYFLLTGTMPWWSRSFADIDLEDILDDFYAADRTKLKEMLVRTGKNEQVRKRIVNHFSEKAIQQIIRTVEYTEAAYIFKSQKEIVAIQKESQLVKTDLAEFSKAVWLFILHYLMVEQSSNFNKKMFIRSNLAQLAAGYNIAFHDVLHIFYDALEQESNQENFITLQKFIKEIFDDEAEFISPQYFKVETIKDKTGKGKTVSAGIELWEYFLGFGTLPYTYERLSSKQLSELLVNSAVQYPEEARRVMLTHTTAFGYGNQLYELLGAAAVKKIFGLIFPGEERKVSELAAVLQALQAMSPFVKLTSSELNKVLWQFIFDAALFLNSTSLSETDMMIAVINRLEKEYGAGRFTTWRLLETSLDSSSGSSIQHQQAFKTVQGIVTGIMKQPGENNVLDTRPHEHALFPYENEMPTFLRSKKLPDILRYLLQYGSVPWWGEEFYHLPVADMLLELYQQNKPAFVLLFRQAMQLPQMKKRLLDNIPVEITQELLYELPHGKNAALHVATFSALLGETAMMQYYNISFIQKSLFAIAAELLADAGYSLFSGGFFYKEAVLRLSAFLKIKPEDFVMKMLQAAIIDTSIVTGKETLLVLQLTKELFKVEQLPAEILIKWQGLLHKNKIDQYKTAEHSSAENVLTDPIIIGLQEFMPGITAAAIEKTVSIITILEYFFTWHRLPDRFAQLDENEQSRFLRYLLHYQFQHNKIALKNMLLKPSVSAIAHIYAVELFADHKDIPEEALFVYLAAIDIDKIQEQVDDKPSLFTFDNTATAAHDTSFNLQDLFTDDTVRLDSIPKNIRYKRFVEILEYFLRYNKLPGDVNVQGIWKMNLLLKEIAVFLFNHDAAVFQQLLDKQDIAIAAKLHLYDLFAVGTDIVTDKIAELVDVKRENDFMQFLLASGIIPNLENRNNIGEFVDNYLQSEWKIKKQDNIAWLMSSPSLAKIVLEKSGLAALLKFAEQKISWSFAGTSVIQTWFELIQLGISSSFDKERMIELFKRFNINFISGTMAIHSNAEYSSAFLDFLAGFFKEPVKGIYKMLFDFMSAPGNNPGGLQLEEIKKLLLLLRRKLQQQEEQQFIHAQTVLETEKYLSALVKKEEKILPVPQNEYEDKKQEAENKMEEQEKELLKENKNGFYIRNAGLVLFHPFLETFFTRTGLMEKRKFTDDAARNRAVLLLQYLANEKIEHEEHELLLNKILCNVPLTEAVPVKFTPTPGETTICAELFAVVIERWPKMKNATAAGIRASLILRNGVLKMTEDGWHMRVEQKGYDVILQTLPWAFGLVKTGWMETALNTEWI